ncbi:MAG: hypothetical protein ACT4QA_17520 [Panacagrimonas sp.]
MTKTTDLVVQRGAAIEAGNSNVHQCTFPPEEIPEPSAEQIIAAALDMGIDLSGGLDVQLALVQEANSASRQLARRACEQAAIAGLHLIAARRDFKHAEWLPYLEKFGLDRFRVAELSRIGRSVAALSPEARKQLLAGSKKNAIGLASMEPDVLEELGKSGDLADIAKLSHGQCLRVIRNLRADRIKADEGREQAEFERDRLKAQPYKSVFLAEYLTVRGEAAALTEQMSLSLDGLDRVYHDVLGNAPLWGTRHQDQQALAAGTLYHRLYAVQARIHSLLALVQEQFGEPVCGAVSVVHNLSGEEMLKLTERFKLMALAAAGQAEARRIQREEFPEGLPRTRRGRPRGARTGTHKGQPRRG